MQAWTNFFSTDDGLMSAAVIAVTLGLGLFFVRFFLKRIREDGDLDRVLAQFQGFRTVAQSAEQGIPVKVNVFDGADVKVK